MISEGFRSETDPAGIGSKEKNPAGVLRFPAGFVDWADQPCSDPRLSPRACLNRQAGFTAARPAANWIPSSAATWTTPTHNLEVSGRLGVDPRVAEALRRDADCELEERSGCFRSCAARRIGPAKRGSDPEGDRASQARNHWMPISDMVQILRWPVQVAKAQRQMRSGVQRKASTGRGVGASRETNRPRHTDRRSLVDCNQRHHW